MASAEASSAGSSHYPLRPLGFFPTLVQMYVTKSLVAKRLPVFALDLDEGVPVLEGTSLNPLCLWLFSQDEESMGPSESWSLPLDQAPNTQNSCPNSPGPLPPGPPVEWPSGSWLQGYWPSVLMAWST